MLLETTKPEGCYDERGPHDDPEPVGAGGGADGAHVGARKLVGAGLPRDGYAARRDGDALAGVLQRWHGVGKPSTIGDCKMFMFHVEFDDQAMKFMDWSAVQDDVEYLITAEAIADLRDYVEAMGYDWNEVAHVWEVAA